MALTPAEKQARYRERQKGLDAARARGRAYGLHECVRQGIPEDVPEFQERIDRAEAYAAWLHEGRPIAGLDLPPYRPGIVP